MLNETWAEIANAKFITLNITLVNKSPYMVLGTRKTKNTLSP